MTSTARKQRKPNHARHGACVRRHFAPTHVTTVVPDAQWPTASLFQPAPGNAGYLVETDPRFTNYRQWLGSDYLLGLLGSDPALTQKRLGDGYYEQQLIRDQVAELTGRRFLQGYASDEDQYRALMEAGASFAQHSACVPAWR